MKENEILNELENGMLALDEERIRKAVKEAVAAGIEFKACVEDGLAKGIHTLGEKFEQGEIFLPHLVIAGDLMDGAVKILKENLKEGQEMAGTGTVVIGTVTGDIHDIGKNIVSVMLKTAGFEVVDIGVDVPVENFLRTAEQNKADIIGASVLLTSTQHEQKMLIEFLETEGVRDKYKVMVGGGQVTQKWADEIGADGYGRNAVEAVRVALKLMKDKKTK